MPEPEKTMAAGLRSSKPHRQAERRMVECDLQSKQALAYAAGTKAGEDGGLGGGHPWQSGGLQIHSVHGGSKQYPDNYYSHVIINTTTRLGVSRVIGCFHLSLLPPMVSCLSYFSIRWSCLAQPVLQSKPSFNYFNLLASVWEFTPFFALGRPLSLSTWSTVD